MRSKKLTTINGVKIFWAFFGQSSFKALCLTRFPVSMPMTTNNADFEPGCETSAHNPTIICYHPSSWPMKFAGNEGPSRQGPAQLGIGEVEGHGLKRDSAKGIRCRAPSPTVAMPRLRTSWKLACMGFPQAGTQAKRTLRRKQRQRRSKTQRAPQGFRFERLWARDIQVMPCRSNQPCSGRTNRVGTCTVVKHLVSILSFSLSWIS